MSAELFADSADTFCEVEAVFSIYNGYVWHGLWKWSIDRFSFSELAIKLARDAEWAFFFTLAATCALVLINVSRPLADLDRELSYIS